VRVDVAGGVHDAMLAGETEDGIRVRDGRGDGFSMKR
jgi:hypothetical protein